MHNSPLSSVVEVSCLDDADAYPQYQQDLEFHLQSLGDCGGSAILAGCWLTSWKRLAYQIDRAVAMGIHPFPYS